MLNVGDPVALGFVKSLGRPGGNITGLSLNNVEVVPKRLQLLKEVAPQSLRVGVLLRGGNPFAALQLKTLEGAARSLNLVPHVSEINSADGLDAAFARFARDHIDAAVVIPDPLLWDYRARVGDLAIKVRLPAVTEDRQFVEARLLMSYGPNEIAYWRRAGFFVAKILKGAKPADLPVEQPTKFELVINLKTAKALGLTIPPSLLARADQVIE
jgi:putative ABC transport system substrate-binding protein